MANDGGEVGFGLLRQAVLVGPEGEPPLSVGRVGGGRAFGVVLGQGGLERGVTCNAVGNGVGAQPALVLGDQPEESASGGVVGVGQDGLGEVAEALGGEAVGFAPVGEADLIVG